MSDARGGDAASGGTPAGPGAARPDAPAAGDATASAARARPTPAGWIRTAAGKLPATWVTVTLTALFLAATAAFGGLADAPAAAERELPVLASGDTHTSGQFRITLDRAVLIDELPGSGTWPEDGERVLAVTATWENITDEPLDTSSYGPLTFAVDALPAARPDGRAVEVSVARYDDSTFSPLLQPRMPVEVVMSWPVPDELLAGDETLRVTLSDVPWFDSTFLDPENDYWDTAAAAPAAYVDLTIEDIGAGADQPPAEEEQG